MNNRRMRANIRREGLSGFNPLWPLALMEIRDKGLYHDVLGYDTFEQYCKARWSFTRQTAYQFIDSAKVVENVSHGLQVSAPLNERQVRPLARLEPQQQREAWQKAVETAPEGGGAFDVPHFDHEKRCHKLMCKIG